MDPELPFATTKFGEDAPELFLLLVTAEVATGLVVLQDKLELQLLAPEAIVQFEAFKEPDIDEAVNVAVTVQLEVITPVV